jgi:hypothetical protein
MNFADKKMYSKHMVRNGVNTLSKNHLKERYSTKGDFTLEATGSIFSELTP